MSAPAAAPALTHQPPTHTPATSSRGFFGNVGHFFVQAGKGVAHAVVWSGEKIGQGAAKVYEFVKPLFVVIGEFIGKYASKFANFVKENKKAVVIAAISFGLGVIVMGLFNALFCSGNRPDHHGSSSGGSSSY